MSGGGALEFATAGRVVFGTGSAATEIPRSARAMLVASQRWRHLAPWAAVHFDPRGGEPTLDLIRRGTAVAQAEAVDAVVAIGGGSAIDAGKAIAALAPNPGDVLDYLETIGRGQPLSARPLPFTAVPTTSGTGAEVTRNAVLGSPGHGVKASLRSPLMLPALAIVDPDLTRSLPREVAVYTAFDALTQLIEPLVCPRANPFADMVARRGLECAVAGIRTLDREAMAMASLLSGMALANAGLGVVHGFAAAIGGLFPAAPHGAICAALLAPGMRANIAALRARAPHHPALGRYECGLPPVEWVEETARQLEVRPLAHYGVDLSRAPEIVERARAASSMKANPIVLTAGELAGVLDVP